MAFDPAVEQAAEDAIKALQVQYQADIVGKDKPKIMGLQRLLELDHALVLSTDPTGLAAAQADQRAAIEAALVLIDLSPGVLPSGQVDVAYNTTTITASNGVGPYSYKINPGPQFLPPGITISSDGVVDGTPTQAGIFQINVIATDSNGATGSLVYSISIVPA